jgi:hypothetical protein
MDKIKLQSDYYPVFKDVSDFIATKPMEVGGEFESDLPGYPFENRNSGPGSFGSPVMLNAAALVDMACKLGFSVFQTVILMLKNTFEGHVYLNFNLRPDQLLEQGTIKIQNKQMLLIPGFYEQLDNYWEGLQHAWKLLKARETGLDEISFESVVYGVLANHLIRLPVSLCSTCDIRQFSEESLKNQNIMRSQLDFTILCERTIGEYLLINEVNAFYEERFKDLLQQIHLKEDVLTHYDRKLAFAFDPNIRTEDELDEYMYKYLVECKLYSNSHINRHVLTRDLNNLKASNEMLSLSDKVKFLYRSISKNCYEIHSSFESENSFSELQQVFLEANEIYNDNVSELADAILQYMRMVILFPKVLIYRNLLGLKAVEGIHIENLIGRKEISVTAEDIQFIRKSLAAKLLNLRIRSNTEFKTKFVSDDDLTEIHQIYLQKQLEFLNGQIAKIQHDIEVVFNQKSQDLICYIKN